RVMIRVKHAVVLDEVEQIRHLLQVGRHIRVVTREVNVVELHVDHMLDLPLRRAQLTPRRRRLTLSTSTSGRPHRRPTTTNHQRGHKHAAPHPNHLPTSFKTPPRNRRDHLKPHPSHQGPTGERKVNIWPPRPRPNRLPEHAEPPCAARTCRRHRCATRPSS